MRAGGRRLICVGSYPDPRREKRGVYLPYISSLAEGVRGRSGSLRYDPYRGTYRWHPLAAPRPASRRHLAAPRRHLAAPRPAPRGPGRASPVCGPVSGEPNLHPLQAPLASVRVQGMAVAAPGRHISKRPETFIRGRWVRAGEGYLRRRRRSLGRSLFRTSPIRTAAASSKAPIMTGKGR